MVATRLGPARVCALLLAVSAVAGCATVPEDPYERAAFEEANDPLEPTNRAIFSFNRELDRYFFRPLAEGYRTIVPEPGRRSLRNFLNNLRTPVILANDLFQAELRRASITLGRFAVNSTAGVGGLFDVATWMGLEFHDEDFGQTLAVWGMPAGPFIMLPIFGPSSPRHAIGLVADAFLDPLTYVAENNDVEYALVIRSFVDGIDKRARVIDVLDEIEKTSLDFYATIRSLYRQRRADEINNGETPTEVPGPSILSEDGDEIDQELPPLGPSILSEDGDEIEIEVAPTADRASL